MREKTDKILLLEREKERKNRLTYLFIMLGLNVQLVEFLERKFRLTNFTGEYEISFPTMVLHVMLEVVVPR